VTRPADADVSGEPVSTGTRTAEPAEISASTHERWDAYRAAPTAANLESLVAKARAEGRGPALIAAIEVTVQALGKPDHFAWFWLRDRRAPRDVIYVRRWIPNAA
jgi:hypothetical protein